MKLRAAILNVPLDVRDYQTGLAKTVCQRADIWHRS